MKFSLWKTEVNLFLYSCVLSANLSTFGVGSSFAWSSPAIPRLGGNVDPDNNPLKPPASSHQNSWIASLLPLGAAVSCFVSGYLADKIGRKTTLLLSSLPMIMGFLFCAFATNVQHFYIGRTLNGLCAGAVFTVIPMYVGEVAQKSNRGILGSFFMVSLTSGIIFSYAIGPYVTIKILSLCNIAPPLLFFITFGIWAPESPYYWVAKGNQELAEKSLLKLRRNDSDNVKDELPQISKSVEESFEKKEGVKDLFTDASLFKTLCITGGLITFQQISGVNFIFFYMQSIFEESGSSISPDISTVIVGVVRFISSIASSTLVDKLGRRILLMTSAAGTAVSLISFGIYFHLKEAGCNVEGIYWLPIASIISFVVMFSLGFGPIPFFMIGEVFPSHVKSSAATLTIFLCFLLIFVITTFFPLLIEEIGVAYTFSLLAFFCCSGGAFIYFFVPETKGKSLQEIQDMLTKSNNSGGS